MQFKVSKDSETNNKYINQKRNQAQGRVPFKGMESVGNITNQVFAQVQTNKIVEYAAVDTISMVVPRTVIDYTRSEDAGKETLRREVAAATTECLVPGVMAAGIGYMLGKVIDRNVKINTTFAVETDTLEMLKKAWNHTNQISGQDFYARGADKAKSVQAFVEHVFNNTEGLVKDGGWAKIPNDSKEAQGLYKKLADVILKEKKASGKEIKAIKSELVNILGASENLKVNGHIETTVGRLVDGIHNVGRVLTTVGAEHVDAAVEKTKKINPKKAAIVMASVTGLGFFQQYINRRITKKKSGSDAFVGLSAEDRKAEADSQNNNKSSKIKFNMAKALSVGAILYLGAATIANSCGPRKIWENIGSYPKLIKKLEFNGWFPHVNQLRAFYAAIIAGRMLASRDKHELRETDTRDIPGFLNWLVLGSFVSKWTAKKISGGELINSAEKAPTKGIIAKIKHFLVNEHLTSHDEINARTAKMSVEKAKEILTKLGKDAEVPDAIKMVNRTLKNRLSGSIFAGIAYSTLMLGLFVPMVNKHITKKLTAKKRQPENSNTLTTSNVSTINKEINKLSFKDSGNYKINENFSDFIKIQQKLKNT